MVSANLIPISGTSVKSVRIPTSLLNQDLCTLSSDAEEEMTGISVFLIAQIPAVNLLN